MLSTDANGATDSDAVAITVTSVNDGPVNTVPGAQTVNEDTSLSIAGVSVNDVDGNLSTTQLTVTNGALNVSLAGGATISAGANGSSTLTLSGTQAQINAALASLSYQGNADFNGADTLTVLSTDANGATDSDAVAITVTSVNDGPVNTVPGAQSVNEDTALADQRRERQRRRWQPLDDAAERDQRRAQRQPGRRRDDQRRRERQLDPDALGYASADQRRARLHQLPGQCGLQRLGHADSALDRREWRDGLGCRRDHRELRERRAGEYRAGCAGGERRHAAPDRRYLGQRRRRQPRQHAPDRYQRNGDVSLAGGATISAGANGSSTLTLSGTQAQINAALASLSYQGNADFNGADTLTVLSTDANGATDADTVAITVNSVNDGPVNSVPAAQTVNEDSVLAIAGISVNDVDGNLATTQLTVTNGALNVSLAGGATISAGANGSTTLTLSGTQAQINAALASLSYQGSANFNGSDTLTVLSTDTNGVTDADAVSITVASVNDGPVNTLPGAQTATEDTALSIAGISVNDVDGNLSSTRLTVASGTLNVSLAGGATISAGANGSSTLTLSGTQAQINAALASLSYQGNADFAGGDTLTVVSTDANGATDSDSLAITVTAVNDAPAVTSATAGTFAENATGAVYTATRADPDAGDTVTWTLTGPDAALFSIDPSTGVVTLSAAQSFAAPADADGDGIYAITVRATDGSGQFDQRNVQLTLTAATIAQPQLPSTGTAPSTPVPAAPAAPQVTPVLPPLAPRVGAPTLGLPVDGGVAPANLAGTPVPASWSAAPAGVPSQFDLNALPPTSAGQPSTFALTRLSNEQALAHLRVDELMTPAINGHRLFVYQGMPDMRLLADGLAMLRVPTDAFAHTDPSAVVHLEARLANGNPLPGWLRFDGLRGVFSGTPPQGIGETLEVEIVARDTEGREARTQFTLEIDAMRLRPGAAGLALGMDVDKEEAEKARLEAAQQAASDGRAASKAVTATAGVRPGKPGAASFSDQVSAAKTQRDPLLDRIAPSDKAKPGARR